MKYIFLFFFLGLFLHQVVHGQAISDFQPVIEQIGQLENNKDPKCHATASRLEDFMYGTPLSFDARDKRIAFQKKYIRTLWLEYTRAINSRFEVQDQLALFKEIEKKYLDYNEEELGIRLSFPGRNKVFIAARDYRQYSTVAYALRAILSVQQSFLFESETLASLDEEVMTYFKKSIDLSVLALLQESDKLARNDNEIQIMGHHIDTAEKVLFDKLKARPSTSVAQKKEKLDYKELVYKVIDQKLAAYRNYNKINQSVFLRNVQVYFSKILWPSDPTKSKELTSFYTNLMVQFSMDLLNNAELRSVQKNSPSLEYESVFHAVQAYLPHSINMFEDVTYFPKLDIQDQIVIEAYDLDAFRDSGLHWQYLKYALDDRKTNMEVALDPFALELLVEGIAQFAVLVFRMGGTNAKKEGEQVMEIQHIKNAILNFQSKLDEHQKKPEATMQTRIVSGKSNNTLATGTPFLEITDEATLDFEHRNSDWLNRTIRTYVVKEDENLARLAIPPAFGGGGIATEDMDNDGWVDILLLGGRGNRLFKNDKGEKFIDVTDQAGLNWKRSDGNYGEPRQPILLDFDNDGWQDIFISYANDAHRIYRNRGDGTFEDMTPQCNLGGNGLIGGPATAIDYNKDGLLDIYIGYFGNYLNGELPTLKRHNTNGSPNKLFRNMGNFRFENVSKGSGLQNLGWTQAVGHTDINGDTWQDLIVGNDFGVNAYYLNNQDGTFTDVSAAMATDKPSYTMNIGISDLNRDMRPDFYISNIVVMEKDDKYVLPNKDTQAHFDPSSLATMRVVEANDLFISSIDKNGTQKYDKSTAIGRGYSATGWSWDADFFDFDNDGDDDLYCLTGMNQYSVYGTSNEYYNSPDGKAREVSYADSNDEANVLFSNEQGALGVVTNSGGLDYSGTSRSAAFFDMDNDGDLEVVVNDYQNKARLFRNNTKQDGKTTNWVAIKLIGDPLQNISKDAIGAALIITTPNGEKKWKEVYSTTGYLSGHPKMCHFGLGAAQACNLEIRWPNGHVQIVENIEPNKQHVIHYK